MALPSLSFSLIRYMPSLTALLVLISSISIDEMPLSLTKFPAVPKSAVRVTLSLGSGSMIDGREKLHD